jgi:hypothetical protein
MKSSKCVSVCTPQHPAAMNRRRAALPHQNEFEERSFFSRILRAVSANWLAFDANWLALDAVGTGCA